ncbi:MAG: hypothetical protein GX879_07045 [Bacteroidales bacterium]|nr:hypothetical protein [Bacteroidales bacterium]
MKENLIIILVFVVFAMPLKAQVGKKENDTLINYVDINNKKQGKWVKRYDNGNIRYKGHFDNDIPQGTFFYYHPNGALKSVLDHTKKDVISAELYWENGKQAAKGQYNKKHERVGFWIIYFDDGTISTEATYDNDILNGKAKIYYPNGDKLIECTYNQGVITGDYTRYFIGGKVHEKGNYKDNKKEGEFKIFNPDETLAETGTYVQGLKHGTWYFYENNKCIDTVKYVYDAPENMLKNSEELQKQIEWAKENQKNFKQPEDYFDNPMEFFK